MYEVQITKRLKRLQRELSKREHGGQNWYKTKEKLDKEYDRAVNRKKDVRNKIIHKLVHTFSVICYQDDSIKGWMKTYGSKIMNTELGGIRSALEQKAQTPIMVSRFYPSTQKCSSCDVINKIGRDESIYVCSFCGLIIDRDLNAAKNIEKQWLIIPKNGKIPTEEATRREFTPADTNTSTLMELVKYLNNIPRVKASIVEETGSLPTMVVMPQKKLTIS
jgi:putative transposase